MPCDPRCDNPLSCLLLRSASAPSIDLFSGIAGHSPIANPSFQLLETRNGGKRGAVAILRIASSPIFGNSNGPQTGGAENRGVSHVETVSSEAVS